MKKISENKFWQEIISEFYQQCQISQESCNCLNAFLECPEIIEMLDGCELSQEECKQYRAAILDVLNTKRSDLTKREDSILQKFSDQNKKAEEYLLDEKPFVDEHMKESVQFLLFQGICKSRGEELSSILSLKVRYRKYSKYKGFSMGLYEASPVFVLTVGNAERGSFYKREPKDKYGKLEYLFREDGRLVSTIYYISENNQEICYVLYSGSYIYYMIYDQFFGKKTFYSVKILKNIHNKLEYLKWCVYGGLAGIHRVGKETYLYHSNKIGKWWSEEFWFPIYNENTTLDGAMIRELYTVIYDKEGDMSGYKVNSYIGSRLAKDVLQKKFAHISGYNEFYLSEKDRLDTGKDSLRWKYPPNYFLCPDIKK